MYINKSKGTLWIENDNNYNNNTNNNKHAEMNKVDLFGSFDLGVIHNNGTNIYIIFCIHWSSPNHDLSCF